MKTGIEFFHTRNLRVTQSKQSVYPKAEYRDLSEEFLLKWDSCTEQANLIELDIFVIP